MSGTAYTLGQYSEIIARIVRALPKALHEIPYKEILGVMKKGEELATALNGFFRSLIADYFVYDKRKDGWELIEDSPPEKVILPAEELELATFLEREEQYIGGEEVVRRAKEQKANLGQRQAEYLLEHQEEIPEEWRRYYLVFTGTIWRGRGGYRSVPCLNGSGERWCLYFSWLGGDFNSSVRLVRARE